MKPVIDFMLHWLGVLDEDIVLDYVYNEDGMAWRVQLPQLHAKRYIPNDGYFFGDTPTAAVERCWAYVLKSGRMKGLENPLPRLDGLDLDEQGEIVSTYISDHAPVPVGLLVQALSSSIPATGDAGWEAFENVYYWTGISEQMAELLAYMLDNHMIKVQYPTSLKVWPEDWTLPLPQIKSMRKHAVRTPHWLPVDLVYRVFPPMPGERPELPFALKKKTIVGISPRTRYHVMARDGHRCRLCGATAADGVKLEVDHILARAKGGSNRPSNLWTLCFTCNRGKYTDQVVQP